MPGPETEMTIKGHDAWNQSIPVKVDANIHGQNGPLEATINGGIPFTAVIDGGATPVSVAVMATVTAPIKLDVGLGDVGLRNTTIKFKLFGLFTILTIEVGP